MFGCACAALMRRAAPDAPRKCAMYSSPSVGLRPSRSVSVLAFSLAKAARHHGAGGRVLAQFHDLATHRGILHRVASGRGLRDRVRILAVAEARPGLLQRREPGLVDELEQAGRGRSRRLGVGIEADSRVAVVSRYSKPAPVPRAASRIAPVTRLAISVVAPTNMTPRSIDSEPMGADCFPAVSHVRYYG